MGMGVASQGTNLLHYPGNLLLLHRSATSDVNYSYYTLIIMKNLVSKAIGKMEVYSI